MNDILIGKHDATAIGLDPHLGDRHGMIAGATGTGKTVSPMVLAEGFSRPGTQVFLADVKGDIGRLRKRPSVPPTGKHDAASASKGRQPRRRILRGAVGGIFGGRR